MGRMPGALWQPLAANWADMPRMKAWDIFCVHTMVGGLEGTDNYFRVINGPGFVGTESHFGTGYDGTIVQWQDTDFQADANYHGGWHVISCENADTGTGFPKWSGSDVPALTDAQVEANAAIAAWLHGEHGIPLDTIPDAKPGRRGIGSHRLGIPGYMAAGAELWSTANGKACPGDRRVAQIPTIAARAKQLATGTPQEDDEMTPAQMDELKRHINQTYANGIAYLEKGVISRLGQNQAQAMAAVADVAGQVAGLGEAIKGSGDGAGLDVAAVAEAARRGTSEALAHFGDALAAADNPT